MEHLWKQNLRQIEPYVPGEQSSDPDRIKLNANENPYPPAPGVAAVLRSYDPAALCLYPDATPGCLRRPLPATTACAGAGICGQRLGRCAGAGISVLF